MKRQIGDIVTKSMAVKPPTKSKAANGADLKEGEFLAYASVFGVKDLDGDVVQPGAFDKTLADWQEKGLPIPLLWGHNTADPDMNIGEVLTATPDDHGLLVHCLCDLEGGKGPQTHRLIKAGRVNNLSYTYRITAGEFIIPQGTTAKDEEPYFRIDEVDLFEISVVPIGANQETAILAVKSALGSMAVKAGRTLSAKNEDALRGVLTQAEQIVTALKGVLPDDQSDADEEDQDQTSGKEPPADSTATKSPSQSDTATPSPSVYLALLDLN